MSQDEDRTVKIVTVHGKLVVRVYEGQTLVGEYPANNQVDALLIADLMSMQL